MGREVVDVQVVESPIEGVVRDGPNGIDECFAVRGLDELVDLRPKRAQKKEKNGAGEEKDSEKMGKDFERIKFER